MLKTPIFNTNWSSETFTPFSDSYLHERQSVTVNHCFSSQTSVHRTALLGCRTLWTNWAVCAKMLPKSAKLEFSTFTRWCRDTLEVWENLIIFIFEVSYGICQWKNLQNRFTLVEVVTKSCMWVTKYINHHHHQFNTHECMKNKTHTSITHTKWYKKTQ